MPDTEPTITGEEPACPRCKADWQGDPIPETHREHFGGATHFRRVIAICDRDKGACTHFKCPDCGFIFDRDGATVEQVRERDGDA